ncbi:ER membrane protein complex subunit [Sesamum alatum]|uniref:ER membrane protein complex subunit 3 n=1 Tax=Sesamum alatum TaxID=300844 RepID=A0AAE1Y0D6_9LAMI|nr:ER membrane protein complex subunit [Sesamum alatum]
MAEDLVLDTAIRDWVLIPLSVVMVLIGVLRYFVSKLIRSDQVPDPKIVIEGQVIIGARNLRAAANFIPAKSFRARRYYYSNESLGAEIDGLDIVNMIGRYRNLSSEQQQH